MKKIIMTPTRKALHAERQETADYLGMVIAGMQERGLLPAAAAEYLTGTISDIRSGYHVSDPDRVKDVSAGWKEHEETVACSPSV